MLSLLIISHTLLNVITVIGEYDCFYLQNREFINLRYFVKFVPQRPILTPINWFLIVGLKTTHLSHFVGLFVMCAQNFHIPGKNKYFIPYV